MRSTLWMPATALDARTVTVYTSVTQSEILGADQSLDDGDVLPGFQLSIRALFTRAGERE